MANKINILLLVISFIASIIGLSMILTIPENDLGYSIFEYGIGFTQFLGMILVLLNGTIIGTIYFKIIEFLTVSIFAGAAFKIMHWPGSSIILLVSLFGVVITYLIRFINKKEKGHLDILKLLWVLSAYIGGAMLFQHWVPTEFLYITQGLLCLTIIDYIIIGIKSKTLLE
jgi:hypothetical protein